ncbi:hypothetical protein QW131_18790 [Roseibium salinum]|nr:hypothetical protein [Roseibium salinum]
MVDFNTQIEKKSKKEVAAARQKIDEVTSKIETARSKLETGQDISIDIENATLDDVHAHTELMGANIAELIMGLDDVTATFFQGLRRHALEDRLGDLRRFLFPSKGPTASARSACARRASTTSCRT